jgi:hypothetical protein
VKKLSTIALAVFIIGAPMGLWIGIRNMPAVHEVAPPTMIELIATLDGTHEMRCAQSRFAMRPFRQMRTAGMEGSDRLFEIGGDSSEEGNLKEPRAQVPITLVDG